MPVHRSGQDDLAGCVTKLLKCSDKLFQSRNALTVYLHKKAVAAGDVETLRHARLALRHGKEGIAVLRLHRDAYQCFDSPRPPCLPSKTV